MLFAVLIAGLAQTAPGTTEQEAGRYFPKPLDVAACNFSQPFEEVLSLKGLPAPVRAEVLRFFKAGRGLADVDEPFNSTDYIEHPNVPMRRFLRAYLTEDVWFIWYEQGGFVRNANTLALTRQGGGDGTEPLFRATPGSSFTGDLCAGSKAFLAGARASARM